MKKQHTKNKRKAGFTLVELMVTIAIIGILASVVMVSMQGGVDKSKTASAITTMSSILPELVTCADDNGKAKNNAAPTGGVAGTFVCCVDTNCTGNVAATGHSVRWPDIGKSGYIYGTPTNNLAAGTYAFTATKSGSPTITCNYATNDCTIP